MTSNEGLSIGSLLTAVSVLISAAALAYGWRQDRLLRRREYADRIRGTAGRIAAMLERWQILARQVFDDLQPLMIEAGRMATSGEDHGAAHHALRKGLYEQRAAVARRIADERLEAAYVDLYGYDPRIHELFLGAVHRLKTIDAQTFRLACEVLEHDLREHPQALPCDAPDLGETLSRRCEALAAVYEAATRDVIEGFRAEMLKLIEADDERILARTVALAPAAEALPTPVPVVELRDVHREGSEPAGSGS